jgi:hypothetical protein
MNTSVNSPCKVRVIINMSNNTTMIYPGPWIPMCIPPTKQQQPKSYKETKVRKQSASKKCSIVFVDQNCVFGGQEGRVMLESQDLNKKKERGFDDLVKVFKLQKRVSTSQ